MEDSSQFKHLQDFLAPVGDDAPCGENLDIKGDEEYTRIEREVNKANETREWKTLKKDIEKIFLTTKDFRLASHYCKTLLHVESLPINGLVQGLYLTHEYIENHWDCVFPPEDIDEPEEKYIDRINAISEMGSWKNIILPLRKKCSLLTFDGFGDYYLEDLVAFKNGDSVEDKQSPELFLDSVSEKEKENLDSTLSLFIKALELANSIKNSLLTKAETTFIDFDTYLIPNLQEGISILSNLSPNSTEVIETQESSQISSPKQTSSKNIDTIQSRDDVVRLLEMICNYYAENEPSSPLPLLLQRAKNIVHKDFLEVLEELVPDSVSMTEPVFGRPEEKEY